MDGRPESKPHSLTRQPPGTQRQSREVSSKTQIQRERERERNRMSDTDLNALAERLENRATSFEAMSSLYEYSPLVADLRQAAQALRGMGEADNETRASWDAVEQIAANQSDIRVSIILFDAVNRSRAIFARSALKERGGGE